MPFAVILMANTALPYSYLVVTGNAFGYWGHAHSTLMARAII